MNTLPYQLSTDYEKLYELVSNGAIVAGFADYSGSTLKDVVKVMARKVKEQGYIIGCRGIAYGDTNSDNIGEFVEACERCNLEYIEPAEAIKEELDVTDQLLADRQKVIDAIPECPVHGGNCIPHALDWVKRHEARIKELEDAIRVEQSGLSSALAEINKAADGWHWVTEGRGPYPYNDERYKKETGWMIDTIKTIATKALNRAGIAATNVINSVPRYSAEEVRVAILTHWRKEFGSPTAENRELPDPYFVSGFVLAAIEAIGK